MQVKATACDAIIAPMPLKKYQVSPVRLAAYDNQNPMPNRTNIQQEQSHDKQASKRNEEQEINPKLKRKRKRKRKQKRKLKRR
jgi:hypothetical protein